MTFTTRATRKVGEGMAKMRARDLAIVGRVHVLQLTLVGGLGDEPAELMRIEDLAEFVVHFDVEVALASFSIRDVFRKTIGSSTRRDPGLAVRKTRARRGRFHREVISFAADGDARRH